MGSNVAWCALNPVNGKELQQYRLRFNIKAGVLLRNVDYVYIRRTDNGSHIILTPMSYFEKTKGMPRDVFHVGWWQDAPFVYITPLVSNGFLRRDLFDGRRCKVKRDKQNRIYICLTEVVEQ